jgi:hypothetical protein
MRESEKKTSNKLSKTLSGKGHFKQNIVVCLLSTIIEFESLNIAVTLIALKINSFFFLLTVL